MTESPFLIKPSNVRSKWLWKPFKNSARSDELVLYHWMRSDIDETEYRFAKCNKHVDIPNFTDKEYESFLKSPNWTKEETSYLLQLCNTFDLRFAVIQDRYSFNDKKRSMEELKDRYYEIIRKLCRIRQNANIDSADLKLYEYNYGKEVERKKHLESLYKRTLDEINEENWLMIEMKRLEKNRKKLERERESLLRLLNGAVDTNGFVSSLPSAVLNGRKIDVKEGMKKLKRKKSGLDLDDLDVPPSPSGTLKKPEKLMAGPFLRSQRLLSVKAAHVKHVERVLVELGIGKILIDLALKPTIPTAAVCEKFDTLRQKIVYLLELRKHTEKMDHEVKIARLRQQQGSHVKS